MRETRAEQGSIECRIRGPPDHYKKRIEPTVDLTLGERDRKTERQSQGIEKSRKMDEALTRGVKRGIELGRPDERSIGCAELGALGAFFSLDIELGLHLGERPHGDEVAGQVIALPENFRSACVHASEVCLATRVIAEAAHIELKRHRRRTLLLESTQAAMAAQVASSETTLSPDALASAIAEKFEAKYEKEEISDMEEGDKPSTPLKTAVLSPSASAAASSAKAAPQLGNFNTRLHYPDAEWRELLSSSSS